MLFSRWIVTQSWHSSCVVGRGDEERRRPYTGWRVMMTSVISTVRRFTRNVSLLHPSQWSTGSGGYGGNITRPPMAGRLVVMVFCLVRVSVWCGVVWSFFVAMIIISQHLALVLRVHLVVDFFGSG